MKHPNASLLWPHHSRDMKSHTHTHHQGLLKDYTKGEIKTKQNQSWRAVSHVWDANTSVGNLGDAGNTCSHYVEQEGQSFGQHWII